MKKLCSFLIMMFAVIFTGFQAITAAEQVVDPYTPHMVLFEGDLYFTDDAFFLNGNLIMDYEIIYVNNWPMIPLRLTAQELGFVVEWDESARSVTVNSPLVEIVLTINNNVLYVNDGETVLEFTPIIHNDLTYVQYDFAVEFLGANAIYSLPQTRTYGNFWYDTEIFLTKVNTILRNNWNVIVDRQYDFAETVCVEEALELTRVILLEGLANFAESMREKLVNNGEEPHRFDNDFNFIETEINRIVFIDEVSRFYRFTIGVYDVLYDRFDGRVFFIVYQSFTIFKEVDINDPELYIPIFIVG